MIYGVIGLVAVSLGITAAILGIINLKIQKDQDRQDKHEGGKYNA